MGDERVDFCMRCPVYAAWSHAVRLEVGVLLAKRQKCRLDLPLDTPENGREHAGRLCRALARHVYECEW